MRNKYIVVAIEDGEVVDFKENIGTLNEATIYYNEFKENFGDYMTIQLRKKVGGFEKIIKSSNKFSMFHND